ncbi:exopolysaccharide biosynthesis polyprenyl glycosylphosphotransferase [Planobispora rosea]|uniref:Exopolysaccharide biosynthesis polyprenyl glycosylphosphotransferase n=1 Tax=Planobispora rosea TaxID=35762 RepID=A0A8J3WCG9_PLARO|nr:sugar transferase [Planobispora rosea]GGS82937.1 exopolysaccharide biosynthesis polyprenyl glycosylphosphotransferase [Planobispora rosea]GIH84185.1 exopolysaccharide biosynthesis polyprenyl glycosylphosphotransferase [Planobispora rosea]
MVAATGDRRPPSSGTFPIAGNVNWEKGYVRGAVQGDAACGLLVFAGLIAVRSAAGGLYLPELAVGALLAVLWPVAVSIAGGYQAHRVGDGPDEYRAVLQAAAALASLVAIVAYATQTPVARSYVMVGFPLLAFATFCFRYGWRKRLHRRRVQGEGLRRVVAVGHPEAVAELVSQLCRERYHGMRVVAACLPPAPAGLPAEVGGVPVLGDFADVAEAVTRVSGDAVAVLACPELDGAALRRMSWRLAESDTDLYVASALMEVAGPRTTVRPVAGLPLLHVEHPDLTGPRQLVKSAFDKVAALAALLVLSPLLAGIYVAIRMTDGGPAIFTQTRVGKDGREFRVLKFRTMVVGAETLRTDLGANDGNDVLFKLRKDPRVTPIGSWLRRYSLDELPQLVNVLTGEMSLVGPRPPLPAEVARYGTDVHRRLVVKPGMTGLWQVSGRSDLSWEESVRLDLRYVENWSLALDLQILWKTWSAVVRGTGAY